MAINEAAGGKGVWPEFFPEDCPPNESTPADGEMYRVIIDRNKDRLKASHFQSKKESQPHRTQWNDGASECQRCAISLLADYEESVRLAQMLLDAIPANSRRQGYIARGTLKAEHGLIIHSPNEALNQKSHHDWWKPEGLDPTGSFQFCEISLVRQ